ncbi:MAG: glycosyltransferase family 4 protein, partial [Frankiaceae bacterium]|nr:glycosyltransferase family 4 protein [Arenimonas sp.]
IVLRPTTATPEKFYAAADLVCAPSTGDEAFGLAVLEAMSCGVTVVATDIGVIPRILGSGQGDLLVAPDDPAALAERLSSWLERPADRQRIGAILRQRALRGFGMAGGIDRYERILQSLATAHAVGG